MYDCSIFKHRNPLYFVDGQHGWSTSCFWCNLQRGCWLWQVFMILGDWEILNSWTKIVIDTIWLFVQGLLTMATRPTRLERTASQSWQNITSESSIIRIIGLSPYCKVVDQDMNRKKQINVQQGAFLYEKNNDKCPGCLSTSRCRCQPLIATVQLVRTFR